MTLMDFPIILFVVAFSVLWLAARCGAALRRHRQGLKEAERDDFGLILGSTLTLLALIIGFSFSMAISRYDQRKSYEEAEANAIGTEYLRADLLPVDDAAKLRTLLGKYLEQRILFYEAPRSQMVVEAINVRTVQLQDELWSAVRPAASAQPTPITALAVAGMNDVLNSQGYTQAAWWNRIPPAAWILMFQIAIFGNILLGYYLHDPDAKKVLFLILPLILAISFFLIADLDSPRGGLIRIHPQNLISLSGSMHP
ncbi:hypothetical protein [Granulicella sp. L60]|jgi:hypothetical protein|uniref:bestrophin-like domain n=1 Tax=Granulicella sp. L60 TaxID=1641866 RepID=UPI001C20434E|nr:hypothetical protein [Granulicella sp. L60]